MGLMLFPEFQTDIPELDFETTGEFLIRVVGQLDAIAAHLGLSPLSSFDRYSGYDDYYEEMALSHGNPADIEPPEVERWFPAADGLETVEGLRNYLLTQTEQTSTLGRRAFIEPEEREGVLYELEDLAQQLRIAAAHQIKFHLTAPI